LHSSHSHKPMSALGHSRPSHFVPVLNNVRYASDSDHSRYDSELTLWAKLRIIRNIDAPYNLRPTADVGRSSRRSFIAARVGIPLLLSELQKGSAMGATLRKLED
jgi:hypothetical protein